MALLNTILLPFQAGYENIITASGKSRELFVIKRIFENKHYRYDLQLDNSLFSPWGRVSIFAKGVVLCLPFIGHITSIALRCFSSSIFPELPLDFAMKCSPKQKLDIAKSLYTHRSEKVDQATRLTLAKILANDQKGLDILLTNLSYLDLRTDPVFSLKIILENPKLIYQHYYDITFAQQLFRLEKMASPEDKLIIARHFIDLPIENILGLDLMENEEFALAIIKTNPKVLELISDYEFSQIILSLFRNAPPEDKLVIAKQFYLIQPEIDQYDRLALAEILATDKEGLDILLANLSYLDLMADPKFSIDIIQEKPELLDEIENYSPAFLKYLTENFNPYEFGNEEFALAIIQKEPELLNKIDILDCELANKILSLLEKLTSQKKLVVATQFYRCKPEIDPCYRLVLARILAKDAKGLDILLANLSYLDLTSNEVFLEFIQEMPQILEYIKVTNPQFAEQIFVKITDLDLPEILNDNIINFLENSKSHIAKQLLLKEAMDYKFIADWFGCLCHNQDLTKALIKEIISQTREVELSDKMKLAIIHALTTVTNNDFIEDLLKDQSINTTLANILLRDKDCHKLLINNIQYLDLLQNTRFNQELFQMSPIPKEIKDRFFMQLIQEDPTNPEFINHRFNFLSFNDTTQQELIRYFLEEMGSYSEQIEIAIAHVIIKKYPRGPKFLLENIHKFTPTLKLADLLLEIPNGSTYINDNIDNFDLSEEQRDSLLKKCTPPPLV